MARIRSVHPELFTDEEFVGLSMAARVLLIGLGTQADDQGVFQWKPTGLRLKIFPNDMIDVSELLAELRDAEFIRQFEDSEGRSFGAVRNFCEHQRPKRPNAKFELPERLFSYVKLHENSALAPSSGEQVGEQCRTGSPVGEGREGESDGGEIPPIVPREAWLRYLDHRKQSDGRPLGEYARSRALAKLVKLAEQGNDPTQVIDNTIENNWKGLFPIKGDRNGNRNNGLLRAAASGSD